MERAMAQQKFLRTLPPFCRMALLAMIAAVLLVACASQSPPVQRHTLAFSQIIDLTHIITEDMPQRPGALPTRFTRPAPDGPVEGLQIDLASGSSLSAPAALVAGGRSVDQLSPADLVLPAVVLDVRDQ